MSFSAIRLGLLLVVSTNLQALDLGVHGRLYPIDEQNLIEAIQANAQADIDSGAWKKRTEQWRKKARYQVNRPNGIQLPRTAKTSSRLFDPSVVFPDDIKDAEGNLIYSAGRPVNPLSYISWSRQLIFIDGDDREQIDWMISVTQLKPSQYKVVLTNGPVMDLMNELNQRLYFDQNQNLVRRLNIQSLPARVYQQGLYLRIDEVKL